MPLLMLHRFFSQFQELPADGWKVQLPGILPYRGLLP